MADVERHNRVNTQGLIHNPLQILHVLHISIRWRRVCAKRVDNLLSQLLECLRVTGQLVECPGESGCSGVTTGEKNGDKLVPKHLVVTRETGEGMKEGVTLGRFGLSFELGWRHFKGTGDVGLAEVVDDFEVFAEFATWDEHIEGSGGLLVRTTIERGEGNLPSTSKQVLEALHLTEGVGEFLLLDM